MIEEYHIPDNKVHCIVHDSASNMIKGIDQSKFDALACFTHTNQLALKECIFTQESVKKLQKNAKIYIVTSNLLM